jgi:hypothetical protein
MRHVANDELKEEVFWYSKARVDECKMIYDGDAVIDSHKAVVKIRGRSGCGLLDFGSSRGLFIEVNLVWQDEVRSAELSISFDDLHENGYKGGLSVEDDGYVRYGLEMRHVKKLVNNIVLVYDGGDIRKVKLDWIRGKPVIFKRSGLVGGVPCFVSIRFTRGILTVRVMSAKTGLTREIDIDETLLVTRGWIEYSRLIANSTSEGLGKMCDNIFEWQREDEDEDDESTTSLVVKKKDGGEDGKGRGSGNRFINCE